MIAAETIANVLSVGFANKLDETVMNVSKEISFTKRQMIEDLDCGNFLAAARLNKALKKLKITTTKKLSNIDPASLLRVKGIGEASVYVAMCILDSRGYDVEAWWGWSQGDNVVKFASYQREVSKRASRRKVANLTRH